MHIWHACTHIVVAFGRLLLLLHLCCWAACKLQIIKLPLLLHTLKCFRNNFQVFHITRFTRAASCSAGTHSYACKWLHVNTVMCSYECKQVPLGSLLTMVCYPLLHRHTPSIHSNLFLPYAGLFPFSTQFGCYCVCL